MADDPRALVAERLARTYAAQMAALRDATERGVAAAWDTLGSYNRADIDPFMTRALPVVEAAQTQAAALTDAYVAQQVQIMAGDAVAPAGIVSGDVVGAAVRNGTAPETVYGRSFIQVWSDLANGVQWVDAVRRAALRIRQAARTDVSLAGRQAAHLAMGSHDQVWGYRRVLNGRSCRFCAVASTQRYKKANLMPLHSSCDCGIAPIIGRYDPGRIINQDLLSKLRDDSYRNDYWNEHGFVDPHGNPVTDPKKIRAANRDVKVVDHGELGPTLVSDRHHLDKPGTVEGTGRADDGIERLSSRGGGAGGNGAPPREPPLDVPGDGDDANRKLDEAFREWEDSLTDEQREAIRRYQSVGKGYEDVQRILRGELDVDALPAAERERVLKTIRDLKEAIATGETPQGVQVFRGVRDAEAALQTPAAELPDLTGMEVPFSGFFSTTTSEDVAVDDFIGSRNRPGAALFKIQVPEGHPAAWLPNVGDPELAGQGELLFPPESKMLIEGVHEEGGLTIIEGRLIP